MKSHRTPPLIPPLGNSLDSLPPGIVAMELSFRCTACDIRIRIDARAQGCFVHCPSCRAKVTVPRWSDFSTSAAAAATAPQLSAEEVAFLTAPFVETPAR